MGFYEIKNSETTLSEQRYYFVLKASNGEIIATSEMYKTKQAAENGIRSVQLNGASTDIKDLTSSTISPFQMTMDSGFFNPMNNK
ncbi:YegP family protein [Photobacterium leiognathi]|uniref:YegP family protein n=1 Tax=Photobacterium leiognathi TaxID=553611 RepID=UPI00273A25FF|nr:YegP family protein [Photobacterium leiognathi]